MIHCCYQRSSWIAEQLRSHLRSAPWWFSWVVAELMMASSSERTTMECVAHLHCEWSFVPLPHSDHAPRARPLDQQQGGVAIGAKRALESQAQWIGTSREPDDSAPETTLQPDRMVRIEWQSHEPETVTRMKRQEGRRSRSIGTTNLRQEGSRETESRME